ncbi:tRNA (N(6)-L-threonylcarbamoyladenosine(37)-C(2))-methylthiotransferase MtaB [Desulfococcaceae bacterium HSG8]|nr:tRNA (N(6)-L-threonylcarbamoyladenosine(37)-C(2))-methylthiotransferase MtaB [Desulfococcaceae bacterium HSG8]
MKKFAVTTLGCKVNQYESESVAQSLEAAGQLPAGDARADICIINTCTVTHKAAMQSRQAIRQAIRANPGARIIVTGCYAQTEPDEIKKIEGVHDIISHSDKHRIPGMVSPGESPNPESRIPNSSRTRPFLKIQDGCDAFCTYCIVPYARGPSRSMQPEEVLENIARLGKAGFHEVVLTGIHLGCYGLDLSPPASLSELLSCICKLSVIDRIRLSSTEPHELNEEIISLTASSDNICHHFHIPLQSGNDGILKKMHRPYTREFFTELILNIRKMIPDAAIGVDTLIGFPGESEAAFEDTYTLIEQLPVTYLHVFPFSPRRGTPAYGYPARVPPDIIKARCGKMRELGNLKKKEFYRIFLNKTVEILIEGRMDKATGLLKGVTSNYIPVLINGEDDMKNTFVSVRVEKTDENNRVFGEKLEENTKCRL